MTSIRLGGWRFHPNPSGSIRGDETLTFRTRLAAAVRSGHSVGAGFALSINSGPDTVLQLHAPDPASTRWLARAFVLAYDRHQWGSVGTLEPTLRLPEVWDGGRARAWPDPFRTGLDAVSAIDLTTLAFAVLPSGARCVWSFRPSPLDHRSWWEGETKTSDAPVRRPGPASDVPSPRRPAPTEVEERPPFWQVRVRIERLPGARDPLLGARAARAMESATRSVRGNGLRFHRRRPWAPVEGVRFTLSESEVVLSLPSPACPVSSDGEALFGSGLALLPLGRTVGGRVVGPRMETEQGRHLAVLGETGMGKSSLLVALCKRVVGSSGLVLFDPLGDTVRAVDSELPAEYSNRVTRIDPGSTLGLNALEGIGSAGESGGARQERQLNDLVHSLRRVRSGRYADSSFWGPRLEEMLTRALRAAAVLPEGTLLEAHALLASGGRGFRALPADAVEAVRELGDRIRSRPDDAEGARRLLYEVTRSRVLVRMLCAPTPTLHAADLVRPGQIVLIAGNAAEVGEATARYLLSVYLALVWSVLLARPSGPKTFVVIDEAQWFVHESLAEMLRLGRRGNIHVILATQSIASLPDGVAEAVWTNVADFVAFRGSPEEAREFARIARGVPPEAILSLPRGEAAVLLGKGNSVQWVRMSRVGAPPSASAEALPRDESIGAATPTSLEPERPTESEPSAPSWSRHEVRPETVLRAIALRLDATPGVESIRVSLNELRKEVDPSGRSVRAAGAILGRAGAIVGSGRDELGPFWWIDPHHFEGVDAPPESADEKSGSEPPQPS